MVTLEELQKMNKNELITIIGNYISDQKILLNQINGLEKQTGRKKAEIERLTEELANERNAVMTFQESANAHRLKVGEIMRENAELQKQVERLTEERNEYKGLYETMYRKWSDLSDKEFNCDALRKEKNEYFDKAVELQKQVDELTEEKQQLFQAGVDTQEQMNTLRLEKKRENAELQKQLDELKAKIPNDCVVLSKEKWHTLMGDTYTSKEVDEIVAYKERVKAREIAQDILTKLADDFDVAGMDVEYPLNRVKIYAKEYGVEME